ncbi:hypothetical protein GCM10023321_85290 [Pseudonocardia eucalypti]|uniref:HTH tetR-type domain-containing protein n=1 Tax=Pseudonocardia eucalypti TaxID=648755 RepID=A0ABP9RF61_9PSEU
MTVSGRVRTKGGRTRRRLLDAAAAEVARNGRAGASLSAIAAAAGLKAGSIYFHFESRERLIEAVLEEGLRATLERLDAALAAEGDHAPPAARLRAAIRAHAVAAHELRDYTVAVLAPDFPDGGTAGALRRDYVGRWAELVAEAQSTGHLPDSVDPRLVRDLLFGALNAVSLAGRPPAEAASAVYALLRLG